MVWCGGRHKVRERERDAHGGREGWEGRSVFVYLLFVDLFVSAFVCTIKSFIDVAWKDVRL